MLTQKPFSSVRFERLAEWTINSAIRLNVAIMDFITSSIHYQYHRISLTDPGNTGFLSIFERAPTAPGEYGELRTIGIHDATTELNIVPVRSYPEGSSMEFSSNEWVIICSQFPDTYICIDPHTVGNPPSSIGTSSRLRNSPIFRRSCELVHLTDCKGDPDNHTLGIKSLRFPDLDLTLNRGEGNPEYKISLLKRVK